MCEGWLYPKKWRADRASINAISIHTEYQYFTRFRE
nr:MAG TPA: hypothetical protein [Caudoviricetes sp.]